MLFILPLNAASFSAHLHEWAEGLSAQLGSKQKREAACAWIQFPCSYSFTFLITFFLNLLLKTPHFVSVLGKPTTIFWLLFWYSFFIHKHAKPWTKLGCWKSSLAGVLLTELFLYKVGRNYLLLTGYCKHENNTHGSHFSISNSITLAPLMTVLLKMLPAFSLTTLSKLQETNKMTMNHPSL